MSNTNQLTSFDESKQSESSTSIYSSITSLGVLGSDMNRNISNSMSGMASPHAASSDVLGGVGSAPYGGGEWKGSGTNSNDRSVAQCSGAFNATSDDTCSHMGSGGGYGTSNSNRASYSRVSEVEDNSQGKLANLISEYEVRICVCVCLL